MLRFILVNCNKIADNEMVDCTMCHTPIGKTYVRDISTRTVYHSHYCLDLHILKTEALIGGPREAKVS